MGKTLIRLTVPMIFGMVGIVAFNLVDTFFVGKLGTDELAALGFILTVVLTIQFLAMGIGIGSSAVISRAVGEGNHHQVKRLTTDSLILAFLLVAFVALVGIFRNGRAGTLRHGTEPGSGWFADCCSENPWDRSKSGWERRRTRQNI